MHDDLRWEAVLRRERHPQQPFFTAVRTTRIYCLPSCPARHPHRRNVEFFDTPDEAEAHGYRPCRRCNPRGEARPEPLGEVVVAVCRFLEQDHDQPPTLAELGARFCVSPYHLQRTFTRLVGVSPRAYADAVRQRRLKASLKHDDSTVTAAVYAAGYASSSSAYTQAGDFLGMTPIHYRRGGEALHIGFATAPCRLGHVLIGATVRGVCAVSLGDSPEALIAALHADFPGAHITQAEAHIAEWVAAIAASVDGRQVMPDLPLDIQATGFQRAVWELLRTIPRGETRTYAEIAALLGQPTAARAVAGACARNRTALLIPCHRVVRSGGAISGYHWGAARKRALLDGEKGEV